MLPWMCPDDGLITLGGASGASTRVDRKDFERFGGMSWHLSSNGYVRGSTGGRRDKRCIYLHRLILDIDGTGLHADHINGDRLDNRRCNLRAVTQAENNQNLRLSRSNSSGHRGVYWSTRKQRWKVQVKHDGRTYHGGSYTDLGEAAAAAVALRATLLPYSADAARLEAA